MNMNIEVVARPSNELLIQLDGEMDALGCSAIRPALEQIADSDQINDVMLDLSRVSFIDSSGIGVIVFLFKRLKSVGRALQLVGVQGQPEELMDLLRISSAIPINVVSFPSSVERDVP
jgi:anti-anti-sigma factor